MGKREAKRPLVWASKGHRPVFSPFCLAQLSPRGERTPTTEACGTRGLVGACRSPDGSRLVTAQPGAKENTSLKGYALVQAARDLLLEGNWFQAPLPWSGNEAAFSGKRCPRGGGRLEFILILAEGPQSMRWGMYAARMRVSVRMCVPACGVQSKRVELSIKDMREGTQGCVCV